MRQVRGVQSPLHQFDAEPHEQRYHVDTLVRPSVCSLHKVNLTLNSRLDGEHVARDAILIIHFPSGRLVVRANR